MNDVERCKAVYKKMLPIYKEIIDPSGTEMTLLVRQSFTIEETTQIVAFMRECENMGIHLLVRSVN